MKQKVIGTDLHIIESGYAVINEEHPSGGEPMCFTWSFRRTKKECISDFSDGTRKPWHYWKRRFNYRCVPVKMVMIVPFEKKNPRPKAEG